jgi:hypothetical protein
MESLASFSALLGLAELLISVEGKLEDTVGDVVLRSFVVPGDGALEGEGMALSLTVVISFFPVLLTLCKVRTVLFHAEDWFSGVLPFSSDERPSGVLTTGDTDS